jgi:hypothetical protein
MQLHYNQQELLSTRPWSVPPPPPQASSLAARVAELESEVDAARSEARSFGSMAASKERDAHRRLEGLQDELEHAHEQVTGVGGESACRKAKEAAHVVC